MINRISIQAYIPQLSGLPIIDVRSPSEFKKGHIPGAVNIPLFSDRERAAIGTVYKQESQQKAIELGYMYVNPKLDEFIKRSFDVAPDGNIAVHCWRGGMRSQAFAEHLDANGFKNVFVIEKGYKAFRNQVLNFFETPFNLHILGGYTGSGKTHILQYLKKHSLQVIDLEGLAHHKGSAFGGIGLEEQPSTEQFENNLFWEMKDMNFDMPIWLEDESINIGSVKIPTNLFSQMREAQVYFLEIPKRKRAEHLAGEYGVCDSNQLAASIKNITKRLGGLETTWALEWLNKKNYYEAALLILNYYDKSYLKGLNRRSKDRVHHIELETNDPEKNAMILVEHMQEINYE